MDRAFQVGKKKYHPVRKGKGRLYCVLMLISKRSLFYYFRRSGIRSALDAFRFVLAPLS